MVTVEDKIHHQREERKDQIESQKNKGRTVAQHLVQQLTLWGVERIYGVIGDANLYLLDALGNQNKIQYIACRHETNAALMASAEAKLTGKLAVCTSTCGPGITLLLNGLADAWADKVPVLAITGQVERKHIGTGTIQDIDQQLLIQPIAQYSSLVADSQAMPELLNIAAKTAVSRGAVTHLSIPKDVWLLPVSGGFFPPPTKATPAPTPEQIQKAVQVIDKAKRPIILAGRGIESSPQEVVSLAEKIQAPFMVTMPAKCFVPNDHPLFVGGLGQAGTEISRDLLNQADLCIILGATWWPKDYVPSSIPIVQIDASAENIGTNHPTAATVNGDLAVILPQLTSQIQTKANKLYQDEIAQKKTFWNAKLQSEINQQEHPLTAARVMNGLQNCIASDAIITIDVGDHTLWFERIFQFKHQKLIISGTWRTLGFGLPAGIACQLTQPDRQVVSIAGDGGAAHSIIDLITAATYNVPLTLIIINNGGYMMEKNRMDVEGLNTLGSQIPNPDYVALAKSCGAEAFRVTKLEELETTVREALSLRKPTLVEVHCTDPVLPHTKILPDVMNREA